MKSVIITALIVAGGRGSRLGDFHEIPKQYIKLKCGSPIILKVIETFLLNKKITNVQVVIHKNDHELYYNAIKKLINNKRLLNPVFGGELRQQSVFNGLQSLKKSSPHYVLIHDAARPFVSNKLINRVIAALQKYKAVSPGIKMIETIKLVQNSKIIRDDRINKDSIYKLQTPQGFDYNHIFLSHEKNQNVGFPDDISVIEYQGYDSFIVEGEEQNYKITNVEDIFDKVLVEEDA